jgi:alpha-beta hydrolase superfamily lysophospholipase
MTDGQGRFFADRFLDGFGTWMLGYTPYGGGDVGDVIAVADAVGEGGEDDFYEAWVAAGDRAATDAERTLADGHRSSAADLYLRASAFYASAYHPLFGAPVDPRLVAAYRRQLEALDTGLTLRHEGLSRLQIPLGDLTLPGYLIPAHGHEGEQRPVIILVNGYDATMTDLYFASAVAALRRGYHCVIFDGPGQGGVLYEQGVPLRPDWEAVVSAVIDVIEPVPIVDASRIAVSGWSLGGYFVPRAATSDSRIAACIADPGQWDLASGIEGFLRRFGATAEQAADPAGLSDEFFAAAHEAIAADRQVRWSILQRGFWANGVTDLRGFVQETMRYTFRDKVDDIRCPVLITMAENDPIAASAEEFYEALTAPKTLLRFTADEGAGDHCEMMNRSLVNRRALDWLDGVFTG